MTPTRLFILPLAAFVLNSTLPGPAAADSTLPTAKEVVERYDQALGGRDAILRHTSSTMRGTLEVHQSDKVLRLPFVYLAAAPYLRLEKVTLPDGAGDVFNGFDGENAWSFDPRPGPQSGAQTYSGDDRESQKRDADFYYALNELSWFKSMETVGIEDFEGRPSYRLHGINNWNKANDHLYDKETGLLTAYDFESGMGLTHEIFSDYKKIDGILVPMKQTVKVKLKSGEWAVAQVLTYETVTFNDVDPAAVTPPQSVRDFIAGPKQAKTSF
jgi:hypothetical protein